MTTPTTTLRRGALAATAALAVAAPATHAAAIVSATPDKPQPPSAHVIETGIPAGQTEHGSFTSTNVNDPHWKFFRRVEYWATSDRWMATATDRAGHLIDQQLGGPEGWTTYTGPTRRRVGNSISVPAVHHSAARQLPPFPGYGAPGNQEGIASGWFLPVAGAAARTIAGFTGTVYEQNPTRSRPGETDLVVLQDGTLAPLLRETKIAHPGGGGRAIDFQDRLRSREDVASPSARVQLTHQTYLTTVRRWRNAVKAYKAHRAGTRRAAPVAKTKRVTGY
jgi:hypothetical protein